MVKHRWVFSGFHSLIIVQLLLALVFPSIAFASSPGVSPASQIQAPALPDGRLLELSPVIRQAAPDSPTTLSISIVSAPWVILDHNNPSGAGPHVFMVEAVVTNTGTVSATNVMVNLDYNSPPNWVLLSGEDPERTVDSLAPGEAYHAYWFAHYSSTIGDSFQYSVSAVADNAMLVSTSHNAFGDPLPNKTVQTRSYLSTGNSGIRQVSADIIVGVAFTMTVRYDLSENPTNAIFSPVGNPDFNPGAYRLLATKVRFFNDAGTQQGTVYDRLFFPTLPAYADNAEATYTFIALTTQNTSVCSYMGVGYGTGNKYDQFYCNPHKGTQVYIQGELTMAMHKVASATIQQGQQLPITIQYTNTGTLPLTYVWFWDEVDPTKGKVITSTITPAYDPLETTSERAAWYIGGVPASSQGTLSFDMLVDGAGQDLPDGAVLVNHAFFGINQGSLPEASALTSTYTTTLQAPTIAMTKSDGLTYAEQGDVLTYTLRVTNTGSVAAHNVVITDVIPAQVTLHGAPTPAPDSTNGDTLVWNSLGPIAASGGSVAIQVPVQVDMKTANGAVLSNNATVRYENPAGYVYQTKSAQDLTTVRAPVLSISKSDYPDPVLTGKLITYTLSYDNTGPAGATNTVITDRVPLSTTFQSCSPALICSESGGVVTWNIGDLAASQSGAVQFSTQVDAMLLTGEIIHNDEYGILADQVDYLAGDPIETEVNRDAAFFDGKAFIDANINGVLDPGESGISGVHINLPKALVPSTTTNGAGYYHFRVEVEEPVSITADLPAGYFRTTSGTVYAEASFGITQTINFGYAPDTSPYGVAYGTVYHDNDFDGQQELGDLGLSGVTITSDQAFTPTVTTNAYGGYTLRYDSSGAVTITETNPPYFVSTTPDVVNTTIATGSSNASPYDFGDFMGIKISGMVYEDANVNGAKDTGEGGVPGATVQANGDSQVTDGTGEFALFTRVMNTNPVNVAETDPAGYVSTDATPGSGMQHIDANTLRITTPVSGTVYSGAYFGDVLATGVITVTGMVWNDNGAGGGGLANGVYDGAEPGLAGAVVALSSGLSAATPASGVYSLYGPPGELITITETNPSGYVSTNAVPGNNASKINHDTLLVQPLTAGATTSGNLFGDVLTSSAAVLSGTVYDDSNENGQLDLGEAGFSGVTVTLEISGGLTSAVLTGSNGEFEYAVAPGAHVRITSGGPENGYYPTTPESLVVLPPAAGQYGGLNFGYSDDLDAAVIFGVVFDDLNSNGEQDIGEPGLVGAVIRLDGGAPITTTASGLIVGTFSYSLSSGGIHVVSETNPPGYRSTTPDTLNVNVSLGHSYYVDYGDTSSTEIGTIYGTVFDDLDGNGMQSAGEAGLPGVVISVTVSGGVLTATTKAYGQYTYGFEVNEAGYHTVTEQDPAIPGYHSTTPDEIHLFVELGHSYTVNFGDTASTDFSSIMGTVFDDTDGNGIQDPAETGLTDVLISLSNGMTATTTYYGTYTFAVDETGLQAVTETDPPGYHSTTPNAVGVDVDALGKTFTVNFGDNNNPNLASFFGTVFEDLNVNAAYDLGEPGLSGVTVTISEGLSPYVTNAWGHYTFRIEMLGAYTVTETDPSGYVSTNAIPADAAVTKVDNNALKVEVTSLNRDFGDNRFADVLESSVVAISGMVWNDNGAGGGTANDGVRDTSEPGLVGAVVSLSSGMTHTTQTDGAFMLYAPPLTVTLSETNPSGYVSSGAIAGNNASVSDADTILLGGLSGGNASTGNGFGDALPADLTLVKADDPDPVVAGETLAYTLVYTNSGPSYAQAVVISDTLPADVEYGGVVSQPAAFTGPVVSGRLLTWNAAAIPSDTSNQIVFTVTVNTDVEEGATLSNLAEISSNMTDLAPEDNLASQDTLVAAHADLSISKSDNPDPVAAGGVLTYTLAFANGGPSDAVGVIITDSLPSGVDFGAVISEDPAGMSFDQDGSTLTWDLDSLAAGEDGEVVFTVTVKPDALGVLENQVEIASETTETDAGDNQDSEVTSIGSPDTATIYGFVFIDEDCDGVKDGAENGLASVLMTLDDLATTTTDANGLFYFLTPLSGTHALSETQPAGYFSTSPDLVNLSVALGTSYRVDFSEAPDGASCAAIYGTVFEDADKDGVIDIGELGISGVDIALDGVSATTTGDYGAYTLAIQQAGDYEVSETDLPGYSSTTPNFVDVAVTLGHGYQVNYGDFATCTCDCDTYEENDAYTDATELGLGSASLQTHNFCDDSQDWLKFTAEAGDVYTFTTSSYGQRADTVLALYDQDGVTMLASNDDLEDTQDYSSELVWQAPAAGVYFLRVTNRAGLTGCDTLYDVWIDFFDYKFIYLPLVMRSATSQALASEAEAIDLVHAERSIELPGSEAMAGDLAPMGVITHTCPDLYEVDDTWQLASPLVLGVSTHTFDSNPVLYAADKDFVAFELLNTQTITFTVTPRNSAVLLELYDSLGNALGISGASQVSLTSDKRATYYLSVTPTVEEFGCAVGYDLLAEKSFVVELYLPLLMR